MARRALDQEARLLGDEEVGVMLRQENEDHRRDFAHDRQARVFRRGLLRLHVPEHRRERVQRRADLLRWDCGIP